MTTNKLRLLGAAVLLTTFACIAGQPAISGSAALTVKSIKPHCHSSSESCLVVVVANHDTRPIAFPVFPAEGAHQVPEPDYWYEGKTDGGDWTLWASDVGSFTATTHFLSVAPGKQDVLEVPFPQPWPRDSWRASQFRLVIQARDGRRFATPAWDAGAFKPFDLGHVPVGATPKTLAFFKATTCTLKRQGFDDCGGTDREGRKYIMFENALARVSIARADAPAAFHLPLGLRFGMPMEEAAKIFRQKTGVVLKRFVGGDGAIWYGCDFEVPSSDGTMTSVVFASDKRGGLAGIEQGSNSSP